MTWSRHAEPPIDPRTSGAGPRLVALAGLIAFAAGCSGSEPIEVPVEAIPLGSAGGQCVDRLKAGMPRASACMYFDDASCVLVADLAAISTGGCSINGECQISRDAWVKYCPAGNPNFNLLTSVGQRLEAALFVLEASAGSALPAFCSFERPAALCNASLRKGEGDAGCLVRLDLGFQVQNDGLLSPTGRTFLSASGFFRDGLGLGVTGGARLCPSVEREECVAPSCILVDLEVRLAGSGAGDVVILPDDVQCSQPGCSHTVPSGRSLELGFSARSGAVLVEVASALGAKGTCDQRFAPPPTTAMCGVNMEGSGQVTATFGFPFGVVVAGLGKVTFSRVGVGGPPPECLSNSTCNQVYDEVVDVTLTAMETMDGWQFARWTGGPCEGFDTKSCVVRTDQAHRVVALFGVGLELEVSGGGSVTATPPGLRCQGPEPCLTAYPRGRQVVLTREVDPDSVFAEWGGDCAAFGEGTQCTLTMDVQKRAVATFAYEVKHSASKGGTVTRQTSGLACNSAPPETCAAFRPGDVVRFFAEPAAGWGLLEWQDCGAGTALLCELTVTRAADVVGRFGRPMALEIVGGGTVDFSPGASGECAGSTRASCDGVFVDGASVRLTAVADDGWVVDEFSGDCAAVPGHPDQCTVVMDRPRSVTAAFGRALNVAVRGGGRVISEPPGVVDCDTDCTVVTSDGQSVRLVAQAKPDWAFVAWSGCMPVAGSDPPMCDVVVDGPRMVSAVFGRELDVTVSGNGVVSSNPPGINCSSQGGSGCRGVFPARGSLTLVAAPAEGWEVLRWSGCSPQAESQRCLVSFPQGRPSMSVTVEFGRELSVKPRGQGTVTSVSPSSGINCGNDCTEVYPPGTSVELSSRPASGWAFMGYGIGCAYEMNGRCSILMNQAHDLLVAFGFDLAVTVRGQGVVRSTPVAVDCTANNSGTCNAAFASGSQVVLDARPISEEWRFDGWDDSACSNPSGPQCRLIMSQPRSVTATFSYD